MRQELSVRVLLKLGEGLQCLALELDSLIKVLTAAMYSCDFDIAVSYLL